MESDSATFALKLEANLYADFRRLLGIRGEEAAVWALLPGILADLRILLRRSCHAEWQMAVRRDPHPGSGRRGLCLGPEAADFETDLQGRGLRGREAPCARFDGRHVPRHAAESTCGPRRVHDHGPGGGRGQDRADGPAVRNRRLRPRLRHWHEPGPVAGEENAGPCP